MKATFSRASAVFAKGRIRNIIQESILVLCVKKREPVPKRIRNRLLGKKKSGVELLSHSQICSTIVAGPLIDRVRDGNVSYEPAIDTGKKRNRRKLDES